MRNINFEIIKVRLGCSFCGRALLYVICLCFALLIVKKKYIVLILKSIYNRQDSTKQGYSFNGSSVIMVSGL